MVKKERFGPWIAVLGVCHTLELVERETIGWCSSNRIGVLITIITATLMGNDPE